jgi:hypothetical protein
MTAGRARHAAVAIVAIPLVLYPAVVLAGGGATFPMPPSCVRIAPVGSTDELDLVFGRRDTETAAEVLAEKVRGVGYSLAEARPDGCGRWKVVYDGIDDYAQGASSAEQARAAGLEAELEIATP